MDADTDSRIVVDFGCRHGTSSYSSEELRDYVSRQVEVEIASVFETDQTHMNFMFPVLLESFEVFQFQFHAEADCSVVLL